MSPTGTKLSERITAILTEHTTYDIGMCTWSCNGCDVDFHGEFATHADHVASLIQALFTPELAEQFHEKPGWYGPDELVEWSCGHPRTYGSALELPGALRDPEEAAEVFAVRRWVSSWEPEPPAVVHAHTPEEIHAE